MHGSRPSTNNKSNRPIVFANVLKTTTLETSYTGRSFAPSHAVNSSHLPTYPDVCAWSSSPPRSLQHWLGVGQHSVSIRQAGIEQVLRYAVPLPMARGFALRVYAYCCR